MRDLSKTELVNLIDEWILNQKYRHIMYRRLIDGITYEALSFEFDMSVRQIKNIVYKCERKIFSKVDKKSL